MKHGETAVGPGAHVQKRVFMPCAFDEGRTSARSPIFMVQHPFAVGMGQ